MKCSNCDPSFSVNDGLVEVGTEFECTGCGLTHSIQGVYFLTTPVIQSPSDAQRVAEMVEAGRLTAVEVTCPPPPFYDDHWG